jgi:hypothetical protein
MLPNLNIIPGGPDRLELFLRNLEGQNAKAKMKYLPTPLRCARGGVKYPSTSGCHGSGPQQRVAVQHIGLDNLTRRINLDDHSHRALNTSSARDWRIPWKNGRCRSRLRRQAIRCLEGSARAGGKKNDAHVD